MKYVIAHAMLTLVTLVSAVVVSMLVLTSVTDTTPYGVALLGLMLLVLCWIPFGITLNETVGEYQALKRRRRKAAMRRHPSRIKRR